MRVPLIIWTLLIVWASLYPFKFIPVAAAGFIWDPPQGVSDWVDLVANIFFYIPFGFLAMAEWNGKRRTGILAVTLAGAILSVAMETAQIYVPTRDSSMRDLVSNTTGAFTGCCLWLKVRRFYFPKLFRLRPTAWIFIFFWLLWQLFPFMPELRRYKITEFLQQLHSFAFRGREFGDIFIASVFLCAFTVGREVNRNAAASGAYRLERAEIGSAVLFPVLAIQWMVADINFSSARIMAAIAGVVVYLVWRPSTRRGWATMGGIVLAWAIIRELYPFDRSLPPVSFLPFGSFEAAVDISIRSLAGRLFLFSAAATALLRSIKTQSEIVIVGPAAP